MKTLKKTLCLVLAVVMAVGVLVLPANAATEFTDDADITHDEAVAVLSGLSIVNGKGDGTFDPDGHFTREQAAALLAQVVLTPEGAKLLNDSKAVFSDVPVTSGYNKYITWAVEAGYISGYPDGTFKPKNELTGLQLAALMVEVLGEELDSANYQNFVALKTKEYKLSDGINGYVASTVITRDNAVQMMFNAMKYSPSGDQVWYVVNTKDATDKYGPFDSSMDAAIMAKVLGGDYKPTQDTIGTDNILNNKYYTTYSTTTPDAFGRPTTTWIQTVNNKSTTLYEKANATVKGPYYTAKTIKDLFDDEIKEDGGVYLKLFYNGKSVKFGDYTTERKEYAPFDTRDYGQNYDTLGGQGDTVEVYSAGTKDGKKCYDIYVIKTQVCPVTEQNLKDGTVTLIDKEGTKNDVTFTDSTLKAGDYVIYQATDSEVFKAQKAEVISGRITGKNTKDSDPYFLIEGAKTYLSSASELNFKENIEVKANITYNFVLDFQNNVIDYSVASSGPVAEKNYAYVISYAEQQASGGDLLGSGTKGAAARARVFDFITNQVKVVDIAIAQADDGNYYVANTDGSVTKDTSNKLQDGKTDRYSKFVTYVENSDGDWVITSDVTEVDVEAHYNNASVKVASENKYATTTTVMYYVYNNKGVYTGTSYVGYKSFVEVETNAGEGFVEYNSNNTVKAIYVVRTTEASNGQKAPETPASRAIYMGTGNETLEGTEYNFYVGSELKTFTISNEDKNKLTGSTELDKDSNIEKALNVTIEGDKITMIATIEGKNNKLDATITLVGDGFMVVNNEPVYTAENMLVYDATAHKFISAVSIPKDYKTVTANLYAVTDSGENAGEDYINLVIITEYGN